MITNGESSLEATLVDVQRAVKNTRNWSINGRDIV